ncbi:hypothetical protein RvY_04183 [Ramazzottius varieornatus]|uniref:Uncharacterized protein n=1 Tax=Ramazzottius varieornatus TaxID=947166 RepID=A0A1D1UQS4_RAMVA|nr:hypothetical protein RvY_04183 [Ramazzottius varieornatus]
MAIHERTNNTTEQKPLTGDPPVRKAKPTEKTYTESNVENCRRKRVECLLSALFEPAPGKKTS